MSGVWTAKGIIMSHWSGKNTGRNELVEENSRAAMEWVIISYLLRRSLISCRESTNKDHDYVRITAKYCKYKLIANRKMICQGMRYPSDKAAYESSRFNPSHVPSHAYVIGILNTVLGKSFFGRQIRHWNSRVVLLFVVNPFSKITFF